MYLQFRVQFVSRADNLINIKLQRYLQFVYLEYNGITNVLSAAKQYEHFRV